MGGVGAAPDQGGIGQIGIRYRVQTRWV